MNNGTLDSLIAAPRDQSAILDEIRNDRELIARLRITPQELEALSKCVLLGTLTCKQDMLFILRQIREAPSPAVDHANLLPALRENVRDEGTVPDIREVRGRIASAINLDAAALERRISRRMFGKSGILFWGAILAIAVLWNGAIVISRWRDSFMAIVGAPVSAFSPSDSWYRSLDRFSVLLTWEVLFVIGIVAITYLRSHRESRRFKIKPGSTR